MFIVKKLEAKRRNLLERIKDNRGEIRGSWDNYVDGTKVFEEMDECRLVREELQRMSILPRQKIVPVPPRILPPLPPLPPLPLLRPIARPTAGYIAQRSNKRRNGK
jgi:hypothetical protein